MTAERTDRDLTLRELQTRLPWTIRYSRDFRSSPCTHKDFAHAMHHVSKAAGKLHGLADDMDHDRALADDPTLGEQYGKYIADLVVCALRLANTFPGRTLDLQALTVGRIEGKNGVSITGAAVATDDDPYPNCTLECGATGNYCRYRADAAAMAEGGEHG